MTGPGGVRPDRPVMVPQIACYADGSCYVAGIGNEVAGVLGGLPALGKAHDPGGLGPPNDAEATELLDVAAEHALVAGWVQRVDGYWLCPAHAEVYLDSEPRRFTLAECARRHRLRRAD